MKKNRLLLSFAFLMVICPISVSNAATFDWCAIISEYRHYEPPFTNSDLYLMTAAANVDTNSYPVYAQNIPGASGDTLLYNLPAWNDFNPFTYANAFGSPAPGGDWESRTYTFYIDLNQNGQKDVAEPTTTWDILQGSISQMNFVQNVSISNDDNPTITWNPVPNADAYKVRFYPIKQDGNPDFNNLLFESDEFSGSASYSFTYTGALFNTYDALAVVIEAWEDYNDLMINRSTYIVQHASIPTSSAGFDYESYLDANPDLPPSWGKAECMNHYIHYGFWENRAVSFNLDEYLNANPDLPRNWTYEEALNQYNLYGKNENRLLAFDTQEYLSLYSDLPQDWVYDQAYNHFMNYGRQEGRVASFDETAYLEMYSDLPQSWEQAEAFYHYFYYGINEGRVYDPYDEQVFKN